MKIGLLFTQISFLLTLLLSTADAHPAKTTPSGDDLLQVIRDIGSRYDVHFTYDRDIVEDVEVVDYTPESYANVDEALSKVLAGTNLKYVMLEMKYVIIYQDDAEGMRSLEQMIEVLEKILDQKNEERKVARLDLLPSSTPLSGIQLEKHRMVLNVTGEVKDQAGEPLIGVNVLVQGTNVGTATDIDGRFELQDVNENATLIFSYVGYQTLEVPLNGRSNITVTMMEDLQTLDEVVVIGYGTMRKSDLTGSVVSVRSDEFVQGVASNALQLLSGKASGVNVQQVNSEPGAKLTMQIRGAGSINSNNDVLFVIDGLPGGNPANINPADIESIEILKDASAAAIYGTRAANGVALITTKKGNSGVPQVTYSTDWMYQSPSYKFDVLNATDYMQMINDISRDAGRNIPYTPQQIAEAGEGTNWQDQLFRNAWGSNHQLSLSGGTETSKYYTSLGYLDQDGILVSSGYKRYNVLMNLELKPSDKFRFGISLNGHLGNKDKIPNESNSGGENADPLNAALMFDPRISPEKNEKGEYEQNPSIALDNPIALAYGYDYRTQNNSFYGNTFGEYEIIDGLKAMVKVGMDINNVRNDDYVDRSTNRGKANGGTGNIVSNLNKYWLVEARLNYEKNFGIHHLSVMSGSTWEEFDFLNQRSFARSFLSDVTKTYLLQSGNTAFNQVSSSKTVHRLQSLFGRVNYTLDNKYLFTATIRRDGTSRFSRENQFAIFPSLALGWRLSEEEFLRDTRFLSDLKLRFGYGQMGNEGIGNFETISTFVAGGNTVLGGAIQSGAQPARIPNSELKWETTEEINLGLDFGFFESRISGSIEYYIRNTRDQLFSKPVPMSTGFSSVRTNFGTVRNSGIDLILTTYNLTRKLDWRTTFVLSTLKNEVTELPPFVGDIITGGILANVPGFALVRENYPMRAFYGYQITGIFQQDDDIANSAQPNAKPGEPRFLDADGNGVITAEDRVVLGKPFPDITYSINNTFSYNNLSLQVYILGVSGIHTFNANVLESMFPINFDRNIMAKHYFNRWTPENPTNDYPSGVNSPTYFGGGRMINSYTVQDASYIRLKNITLGYKIPMANFRYLKSATVSLSGENLLTITDFDGYDPEGNQTGDGTNIEKSSYNNYPLARIFRVGVSINF